MAYVNFYKGLAKDYSAENHANGIYQCTDTGDTWVFGVKNQSYAGNGDEPGTNLPPTSVSGNYRVISAENDLNITADTIASITNEQNYWSNNANLYNNCVSYIQGGYKIYVSIVIDGTTYYLPVESEYDSGQSRVYLTVNMDYDNITRPQHDHIKLKITSWYSSTSAKSAILLNWVIGESGGQNEPTQTVTPLILEYRNLNTNIFTDEEWSKINDFASNPLYVYLHITKQQLTGSGTGDNIDLYIPITIGMYNNTETPELLLSGIIDVNADSDNKLSYKIGAHITRNGENDYSIILFTTQLIQIEQVSELPASPSNNVLYLIPVTE